MMAGSAAVGVTAADKPVQPYALIAGTVWNANDQPVPGLQVKIYRVDDKNVDDKKKKTKTQWELTTNSRGEFTQRLPAAAADYVISIVPKSRKGPALERRVHFTYDERQDVGLRLPQ
jgi:hypothetical protein